MRCLSVRQPWASLIVAGLKDIENRSWATSHRGPLLIHASLRPDLDAETHGLLTRAEIAALPRGGVIGAARVVDCVTASRSPWFIGPLGWRLVDAVALPFQSCSGSLGLFDVEPTRAALRTLRDHFPLPLFR